MTAAAIARLAGVGRAAVSNWRRRYPEFPKPVGGTSASPTFSRAEVLEWLTATGKADQLATAGTTSTSVQRIAGDAPAQGRAIDADRANGESEKDKPDDLMARAMVALLPDLAIEAPDIPLDRDVVDDAVTSDLERELPVLLDPACGDGSRLCAAAERFGDGVILVGQDLDESATAATGNELRRFVHLEYALLPGDALLSNAFRGYLRYAHAVVCDPPFDPSDWPSSEIPSDRWEFGQPAARDGELAWVQHCYAQLRPHGTAVVAVSARTCTQASGWEIRRELVRSGALHTIVALPRGVGMPLQASKLLWILRRPHGMPNASGVRMVDLSGLADAKDLPQGATAWRRLFRDVDPSIGQVVPRLRLLDAETNLLPSRYLVPHAPGRAVDFEQIVDRLEAMYARIGSGMPHFVTVSAPPRYPLVTLAELERAGAVTIRSREATPRAGDVLLRMMGEPPVVATGRIEDERALAQIIEVDPARMDAHFLAEFLRADTEAQPRANRWGVVSRDDLKRCRIPRLPFAEQRRYGDVFRHLHLLRDTVTSLARVSANVIDQAVHGLTVGALAPDQIPDTHSHREPHRSETNAS